MAMSYLDYRIKHRKHQKDAGQEKPSEAPSAGSAAGPSASEAKAAGKKTSAAGSSFLDFKVNKRNEQIKSGNVQTPQTYSPMQRMTDAQTTGFAAPSAGIQFDRSQGMLRHRSNQDAQTYMQNHQNWNPYAPKGAQQRYSREAYNEGLASLAQQAGEKRSKRYGDYMKDSAEAMGRKIDLPGFGMRYPGLAAQEYGKQHSDLDADTEYIRNKQNRNLSGASDAVRPGEEGNEIFKGRGILAPNDRILQNAMLSDEQKRTYNYLYATQGAEEAEKFRDTALEEGGVNAMIAQKAFDADLRNSGYPGKIAATYIGGVEGAADSLAGVPGMIKGEEQYRPRSTAEYFASEAVRSEPEGSLARTGLELAQSAGTNTLAHLASVAGGPALGSAVFAAQAGARAYNESLMEGHTVGEATAYGAMQALDEEITNYLLGGLSAYGGGAVQRTIGRTPVAQMVGRELQGLMQTETGRYAMRQLMDAIANNSGEAAQEYLQHFTEEFEKWVAYNHTGYDLTTPEGRAALANDLPTRQQIAASLTNPEALHEALIGFLNAGVMNAPGQAADVADIMSHGRNSTLAQDFGGYNALADSIDVNPLHYSNPETYQAAKDLRHLAQSYAAKDTPATTFERGLIDRAAEAFEDQAAQDPRQQRRVAASYGEDILRNIAQGAPEATPEATPEAPRETATEEVMAEAPANEAPQAEQQETPQESAPTESAAKRLTPEEADAARARWNAEQAERKRDIQDRPYARDEVAYRQLTSEEADAARKELKRLQDEAAAYRADREARAASLRGETTLEGLAEAVTGSVRPTSDIYGDYLARKAEYGAKKAQNDKAMSEALAGTFGKEGKKAFAEIPAERSAEAYREFAAYYNSERFGTQAPAEAQTLTPEQVTAAMKAGALDANAAYPADAMKATARSAQRIQVDGVNAGVADRSGINYDALTPQQKLRVDFTDAYITKGLGMDVRYIQSDAVNGNYEGINGSFSVVNGRPTITLDVNAGMNKVSDWTGDVTDMQTMLPVISHEITHFLEKSAPEAYKAISDAVIKSLANNRGYTGGYTINQIVRAEINRMDRTEKGADGKPIKHTEADALHEIVARACEDMLSGDTKAVQAFETLDTQTKATLWDHIKGVLDNIREFFQQMLSSYKSDSAEAKAIRQNMDEFEKIRSMWQEALNGGTPTVSASEAIETAAQNSARVQDADESYMDAVSKGIAEEPQTQYSVRTEAPPRETADIYKLMRLDPDGKIRALFIDANGPSYEMGTWYNADAPDISVLDDVEPGYDYLIRDNQIIDRKPIKVTYAKDGTKTSGHPKTEAVKEASRTNARWMAVFLGKNGNRTVHNVGINGGGSVSTFAYRPGIHAGSLPSMKQIGKGRAKNIRDDRFVWVKGKIAYDAETQAEADRKGGEINDRIPEGGYKYRTNSQADDRISWYISGAFLPERVLSDWEADEIVNEYNRKNGTNIPLDHRRENGRVFNAKTMQLEDRPQYSTRDTTGRQLTNAQSEYFKDSKARDAEGRLLTLYHGTGFAGFTEFKTERGVWLTTSKRDADSYAGNFEGKLFDPNEVKSKGKSAGGNVRIGNNMRFESQEDADQFLKENPDAAEYLTERELLDRMYSLDDIDDDVERDEAEDEYNRLKKIHRNVGSAYAKYELTHSQRVPLSELINNPSLYSLNDLKRAWTSIDRNVSFDDEFDYYSSDDEFRDALAQGLSDYVEENASESEPEWRQSMLDFPVLARIPEGRSGEIATLTNRTYELYANVVNPYVFDNEGRGSEGNGRFYHTIEKAMADSQYDGVIVKNARVGRYQDLGTVVLVKAANQVKLASNKNPTANNDIRFSRRGVDHDAVLAELVEKYGALPKGENAQVDVSLPAQTSPGKKTRRYARTVLESGLMSEQMSDEIKKKVINEALSYEPMTDKASAEYAASVIKIGGVERAQREWDKSRRSDTFTKDDMAVGQFLLKEYASRGDLDNVLNMVTELAAEGTRMGQNIQAMRMLKKYAQQVPEIGLGYIQRTVDQMNRDAKKKMGKKYKEMKISPALASEYLNANTPDAVDAALGKIYKNLGEQVQKTTVEEISDRLRAWRYLSMLGNPRTHVRNLVGNAIFVPAVKLKNVIGAELEKAMKTDRTKSVTTTAAARAFARQDALEMRDVLQGNADKSIRERIMDERKTYRLEALNTLTKANGDALETEDWWFLRAHYQDALAQYITANNLDTDNMDGTALARARKYAVNEAQKATYRDANAVSTWLSQGTKTGKAVGFIMEGMLPFKKTPTNILRRGVEYSPAGLVATLTKGTHDLNTGKITVNEYIDGIASGLSGTAIFGVGMFLASAGVILGDYDDDDDKERRKLRGDQEYSVRIGDYTYTVDWAAPGSLPLFVGVEVMNALKKERGVTLDDISKSVVKLIDPMINMSMLSGLNDTLSAISYSDNKLPAIASEAFYSLLGQFVPTILGQVARTVDTTQRINYQDKNTGLPKDMLYFMEKVQNKIPLMTFSNDPYLNEFGQENVTESRFIAAFQNFISPGYISKVKDDKVLDELDRLSEAQDENVLPKKMPKYLDKGENRIDLTSEQYTTFQRTAGQLSYNILDNMVDDPRYGKLTVEEQAEAISAAYSYAKAVGRIAVQPEYEKKLTGTNKKVYNAVKSGKQAYDAILDTVTK